MSTQRERIGGGEDDLRYMTITDKDGKVLNDHSKGIFLGENKKTKNKKKRKPKQRDT